MPRISELPLLARPIMETDSALVEAGNECFRVPGTLLKGAQGVTGPKGDTGPPGLTGQKGDTGEQGLRGIPGPPMERASTEFISAELPNGGDEETGIPMTASFEILAITASRPCRLRLYANDAARGSDASRPASTAAVPGKGIILDIVFAQSGTVILSPTAHGATFQDEPTGLVPAIIRNNGTAGHVSLTITYLPKET